MNIYLSQEDYLRAMAEKPTVIWIVRKHPRISYGCRGTATMKAFEIHGTYATRKEAAAEVKKKNPKSHKFEYMVGKVELKETK